MWPYLIFLAALLALMFFAQRRRRRQVAQEMVRVSQISFGDDVMTTSGLYGTVVGRNDDGTVELAIAPGVVVKWALAALRTPDTLPAQYRRAITGEGDQDEQDEHDLDRADPAERPDYPESPDAPPHEP